MGIDYAAMPSPCFVLDEARLRANLELLADVQRASGAQVICALKGFAMRGSFPLVREYLPGVAASSLAEARLGHEEFGGEVHAYSPAYIPADFDDVAAVSTHVTFNSLSEFERFAPRLGSASAGLRINPEYAEVETDLYNPCVPGSRLGVIADKLEGGLPTGVEGLHFHTLCEKGSDTLERTVERVEARFGSLLDLVRWLNMGGGHAITREGYDVERLVGIVKGLRTRHPNLEQIILEPGSAVGWKTGELVSTVLDIVDNGGVRSAMLDVSFAAHMPDCLEMPYRPAVIGASSEGGEGHRYHLGGQTCLAGDFMADYVFAEPLKVGDRVVFLDMMHYTMVKTTTFNGVRLPSIAIWRERGELEVLTRFGYEDYKSRL
ncbi:MAG: carboxynorspermidine decarboxylase [Myxococcales bacterium]|nr:carboxynorspermidine decarboxylase [Myxococcales bacterium]